MSKNIMFRCVSTSPLLTLGLLLFALPAHGQEDASDDEVVVADDDEVVVADDDEVVVADDDEVVVADDDEVVVADDDEVVVADDDATPPPEGPGAVAPPPGATSAVPVEEGVFAPGEEPWRLPAAGQAVIWGRLLDKDTGEPAMEAQLKVKGQPYETFTDFDGYYRLELPPGKYDIEVFYEMYEPTTLGGVTAQKDQVARQDVALTPQKGAVEEILIEDTAETETVAGLALKRQKAVASGDAVGREEISKGTDSNAAEAAQRVVGANIIGGRFVYVRGLGERYSNALLGGYPLPSPEPDRAAVPLDVFSASVLDSITIVKTFTPDVPGDFAGGSVQIETRSVPKEPLFKVSIDGGMNTQSTFQTRRTYKGGKLDWFGFDDGTRGMPSSVPGDYRLRSGSTRPDGSIVQRNDSQLVDVGRDMNTKMTPETSGTPIDHGVGVVGGNTWTFKNGQKFGVLGSFNYSHKYRQVNDATVRTFWPLGTDPRGYGQRVDYRVDKHVEGMKWGAFGKASYLPSPNHKLTLSGLHSQLADDAVNFYQGVDVNIGTDISSTQLDWVERGLTFGLLSGDHKFEGLNDAELDWDLSLARAYRDQPDRRDTVYSYNSTRENWVYVDGQESGRHFWATQTENSYGGKLDWLQPIIDGKTDLAAKVGALVNVKERAFAARRFAYRRQPVPDRDLVTCEGPEYELNCPDKLFVDAAFPDTLLLQEFTLPGDIYDAHLRVYSGYAMMDLDIDERLRIAAGPRLEVTDQAINPIDIDGSPLDEISADLESVDVLPAISGIFSATEKLKARMSYSRTLARPQLRELAPFAFADFWGSYLQTGYPDLVLTKIDNVDTRLEYWPSLTEVIAMSVFYKHFTDPIDVLLIPAGGNITLTYRNAEAAKVIGVEFEVRKNLGFLTDVLRDVDVITNLTLSQSRTEILDQGFLTSPSRPLINQAPWVYNLALNYETQWGFQSRISYNVNGMTLRQVGTQSVPDAYSHPRHMIDLVISQKFLDHWNAQLSIENIANDDVLWTQGQEIAEENIALQYQTGTTVGLQIGYEL